MPTAGQTRPDPHPAAEPRPDMPQAEPPAPPDDAESPLPPDLRAAFEASWARHEAAYRYLGQ